MKRLKILPNLINKYLRIDFRVLFAYNHRDTE